MKELPHNSGAFQVEDAVAEALGQLDSALAENNMSATVRLTPTGEKISVEFSLGMTQDSGPPHPLKAIPPTGEPSHFGIEDV